MAHEQLQAKLQRWGAFAARYALPAWESIPDFGLYMDQVTVVLQQYLEFIPAPAEGKDSFVTASTINNYVRLKIMPAPVKKKYRRVHIAYLLMILTLKLSLSMADIARLLPADLSEEQVQALYASFCTRFGRAQQNFALKLQRWGEEADDAAGLLMDCALSAAFHSLLAGKLIAAEGEMEKAEN